MVIISKINVLYFHNFTLLNHFFRSFIFILLKIYLRWICFSLEMVGGAGFRDEGNCQRTCQWRKVKNNSCKQIITRIKNNLVGFDFILSSIPVIFHLSFGLFKVLNQLYSTLITDRKVHRSTRQYPVLRDSNLYYRTVPLLKDSPCITGQYPVAAWEIAHLGTSTWEIDNWEVALWKIPMGKYLTPPSLYYVVVHRIMGHSPLNPTILLVYFNLLMGTGIWYRY